MADEKYKKECNMLYYYCPLKIKIAQFLMDSVFISS